MKTAVLVAGFGGPEKFSDVRPFIESVLRGRSVPAHRVDEVVGQYERIGGASPYTPLARELAGALGTRLGGTPVALGLRHGEPSLARAIEGLMALQVSDVAVVVLSAYRSIPSWNYYLRSTAQAYHGAGARFRMRFVPPYGSDPGFVSAVEGRVRQTLDSLPSAARSRARWLFTAHSIPVAWDDASGYSRQITGVCAEVARRTGLDDWKVVYQSRSGRPEERWLEPDISDDVARAGDVKGKTVVVVPVGFLMDHVEVLFDLDVKARETIEKSGADYARVPTVGVMGPFVAMLADRVRAVLPNL